MGGGGWRWEGARGVVGGGREVGVGGWAIRLSEGRGEIEAMVWVSGGT